MAQKGCAFSEENIRRIVLLLNSDLPVLHIAERMRCSRSAVISINRKFKVRIYGGRKSTWQKGAPAC